MATTLADPYPSAAPPAPPLDAKALFDSVGVTYDYVFGNCTAKESSITWLLEHLPPSASILDIGCGTGHPVCSLLTAAGHSVHGIDVSGVMIAAAARNVPRASFQKIDFKDFRPAEGQKYDAITALFSLIMSVSQQEIWDYVERFSSWLKPGGFFVFATVPVSVENLRVTFMGRPAIVSSLSRDEVLEAMEAAGLEVLKSEISRFMPRAAEAGLSAEDMPEEENLFVYARNSK